MFINQQKTILLTGNDKIVLYPSLIDPLSSKIFFSSLYFEINWRQEIIHLFGKKIQIPRLSALHGDSTYTYSGLKMEPNQWTPTLLKLRNIAETTVGSKFNAVLLNLYRSGKDSMSWHSDNEPELGPNPTIASISLGSERKFKFRHKTNKKRQISLKLADGSLLLMTGKTQKNWLHSVPKTAKPVTYRINLTFRQIYN